MICGLPRVNDIAVGIALMLFGVGLAFFLGKPFIQPQAPAPAFDRIGLVEQQSPGARGAGGECTVPDRSRPGTSCGVVPDAYPLGPNRAGRGRKFRCGTRDRLSRKPRAICLHRDWRFFAGVGGSFLSLYYPGSWSEGLSSGQGLMAVALVIFARWNPVHCLYAALLFGAAGSLGPALQSVGITQGYYLFNAAPYLLTLIIMIISSSPRHALLGAPGELSVTK